MKEGAARRGQTSVANRRVARKKRIAGVPVRAPDGRLRKSQVTRQAIVDTTIACLIKHGCHSTTYPRIATVSGFSRGAMRHHFPTRRDIMSAAIKRLHEKRLKAFCRAAAATPNGRDRPTASLIALWRHVNHPMFMVFIDLALAARRDRTLAAILRPIQQTFRQELCLAALELFPEWAGRQDQLRTAIELSQYMMEGMVLDNLAMDNERTDRLLDFLARQLLMLLGESTGLRGART